MKASTKDILREIRKSGMRFFYICAIIALGVAFFCGIKATSPSMIQTAVQYFSEYDLSDFRLLSTYGFRDEDIKTLSEVDGVEEAVGAYSMDVLMRVDEDKDVIKIMSLPDPGTLNQPILLDGRFPNAINECVVESTKAHLKNTEIGQTITVLNESQTEDTLSHLKSRQFTIVGYVQSPQYISIERGNTTISDGTIDGYMFVNKDTFDYERFTEAYVYTDVSANGVHPYSDEYSTAQDQMISRLEIVGDQILDDNITSIRKDALKEIADAQQTLDDNKKEFDSQISQALDEITSGQQQLDEGYAEYESGLQLFNSSMAEAEEQLASGQAEIERGYAEYEVGRAQLASEILNGQNKLLEGRSQLEQGYLSYNQGIAEFNNRILQAEYELAAAQKEIDDGYVEYNKGVEEFNIKEEQANKQLAQAQEELDQGYKEYDSNYQVFLDKINEAQAQLDVGWNEYYKGLEQYKQSLDEFNTQIEAAEAELSSSEQTIKKNEEDLNTAQEQYDQGLAAYTKAKAEFDASLPMLNSQIEEAKTALAQINEQIAQFESTFNPLETEYNQTLQNKKELESQVAEKEALLTSQQSALTSANQELLDVQGALAQDPGNEELLSKEQNLKNEIAQLNSSISNLETQIPALNTNIAQLETQLSTLETQLGPLRSQYQELLAKRQEIQAQIDTASGQITQAQKELETTKASLDQALSEITSGKAALAQAKQQLAAGKQELEQKKNEGQRLLNEAKAVLDASYAQLIGPQEELDAQKAAGQKEFDAILATLKDAEAEIQKGREELENGREQLNQALQALLQGQLEITKGRELLEEQRTVGLQELDKALELLVLSEKELNDGQVQLELGRIEGERQLADALAQLMSGQQQLDQGRAELVSQRASAQAELDAALVTLQDSQAQLNAGLIEFEEQKADGERQINEAQDEINSGIKEINDLDRGKWYVYSRDDNPGYSGYQEDAERIDNVGNVFPLFFFLVAALVAFTTMTRMVEEERTQIGTLYALGYSRAQILKKYVIYSGTAALIGATVGWIVGVLLLPMLIFTAYNILYEMPDLTLEIPWNIVIISYVVAILCTVGAAVIIALLELRSVPAELMRPKAPKPGKRILLERIPAIWNRFGFISKVSLRNIFRYKARFLMTVIGIAGCTALILAGFGLHDAIFTIIPNQFGTIFKYDQTLIVKDTSTNIVDKVAKVMEDERVSGALGADQKSITVSTDQGTLNAYLIIPEDPSKFSDYVGLHTRTEPDTPIDLTDKGVVVSEKLATNYGAYPGGTINLNMDNEKFTADVTAQTENYLQNYVYMTPALYEELTGTEPEYTVIFVNFNEKASEEADQQQFAADMIETGDYTSAINVATTIDTSNKTLQSLNVLVIVMIVSAGLLAFIVLNNLTNINISERIREIATLKVLGFRGKETNNYIFRENLVLSLFGIAIGIVLGILLLRFIIYTVELDIIMFGREIMPLSYVYSIILTLGFTIIVNFTTIPTMNRVNMVEALKDID